MKFISFLLFKVLQWMSSLDYLDRLFLMIVPTELPELHHDLKCVLFSLLLTCTVALLRWRSFFWVYSGYRFKLALFVLLLAATCSAPVIAWCDPGNPSPPPSPLRQPLPLPEAPFPPGPEPIVVPGLPQPLLTDAERGRVLTQGYFALIPNEERNEILLSLENNQGGNDNLRRMVSTVGAQMIIERSVEEALVHDEVLNPDFIRHRYPEIRDVLHYPRGRLMGVRTYESYVTQIMERGTRESVPYRRVLQAIARTWNVR